MSPTKQVKTCCIIGRTDKQIPLPAQKELSGLLKKAVDEGFTQFLSVILREADLPAAAILHRELVRRPKLRWQALLTPVAHPLWDNPAHKKLLGYIEPLILPPDAKPYLYLTECSDRVILLYDGEETGDSAAALRHARKIGRELCIVETGCTVRG